MASTLEETIARQQHTTLGALIAKQSFWVFVAVLVACIGMALVSPPFLTGSNLFNITRNVTFTAIIALGIANILDRMDGGVRHEIIDEIGNISFYERIHDLNVESASEVSEVERK